MRDDLEYVPPDDSAQNSLLPPPNFKPFYALVEDTQSKEIYHPSVHYVFADDDPEILASASMRALAPHDQQEEQALGSLPPPQPGTVERYILLDLAGDGQTVLDAKSLSADWVTTSSSISRAPTLGGDDDGAMMLKVIGTGFSEQIDMKTREPGDILVEARKHNNGDLLAAMKGLALKAQTSVADLIKIVGEQQGVQESESRPL